MPIARKMYLDRDTAGRGAAHVESAAEHDDTLAHADQAVAGAEDRACRRVHAAAVIFDRQADSVIHQLQRNGNSASRRMTGNIGQCFLQDAIDRRRHVGTALVGRRIDVGFDGNTTALGKVGDQPFGRRDQSEVVEQRWTQFGGDAPDRSYGVGDQPLHDLNPAFQFRV